MPRTTKKTYTQEEYDKGIKDALSDDDIIIRFVEQNTQDKLWQLQKELHDKEFIIQDKGVVDISDIDDVFAKYSQSSPNESWSSRECMQDQIKSQSSLFMHHESKVETDKGHDTCRAELPDVHYKTGFDALQDKNKDDDIGIWGIGGIGKI